MTESQTQRCHQIIHTAAGLAATVGAGLAQAPLADNALIVPIQTGMVVGLARVFDVHLTEAAAKALVLGYLATAVGRGISQVLVGWIPGLGNLINASTAAGLTEAMGWAIAADFDRGTAG